MSRLFHLEVLVCIAAMSFLFSGTKTNAFQETQVQTVSSAPAKPGPVVTDQADIEPLIRDLFAATEDGSCNYDAIRIVGQISRLGTDGSPAVDILIDLLGKPFTDCDEAIKVCPDNARNCLKESRICPVGAETQKYDYLTLHASAALQQIGIAALPKLSLALHDGTLTEESLIRSRLAAEVMTSIGPTAIPFLSDTLRTSDYSRKCLALRALFLILFKDPSSGSQLTSIVPYITPFLNENFETTDHAIYILGTIGPGAAEAVPRLTHLLSYERVLPAQACPVGERVGYIFQSATKDALIKIGTPEAMRAVEQYKRPELSNAP